MGDDALVGLAKDSASVYMLFKTVTEGRRMIQLEGIKGFGYVRQHGSSLSVDDNKRYQNHAQHQFRGQRALDLRGHPVHPSSGGGRSC